MISTISSSHEGRCNVSTKAIEKGTVILESKPLAFTVRNLSVYCSACVAASSEHVTLKHCKSCKVIYYCSRSCQQKDWLFHKEECIDLRRLANLPGEVSGCYTLIILPLIVIFTIA